MFSASSGAALLFLAASATTAIDVNTDDFQSLSHAAFVVSHGMTSYYQGNLSGNAPGYLPNSGQPNGYYWWEGSGFFGSLVDYWYYTGDSTFNDISTQALAWQTGDQNNYEPKNASQTLGNDDIGFWAMTALKCAELKFPDPPNKPSWTVLAQTVFNNFIKRWDTQQCGGGLRWQVFLAAAGYHYKNSVSSGSMFNLGARLGKYTGNQTYLDWAEKAYDWTHAIGLLGDDNVVWDGTDADHNCSVINQIPWTYNQGLFLYGSAVMYNVTGDQKWKQRTTDLFTAMQKTFFRNGVMTEVGCMDTNTCNNDQKSFRSYTMMWLADTMKVASFMEPQISPALKTSTMAAAEQCSGGSDGVTCGMSWGKPQWDGSKGIGEEMSALQAFNAELAKFKAGPIKSYKDGGTSKGDADAASNSGSDPNTEANKPVTTGDKAGASILTILVVGATVGGSVWLIL